MASKEPMHRPALSDAEKCTVCEEDGRPDKQADVWCVQCQKSLCSACLSHHSRYNRSHVTMATKLIVNTSDVLQAESHQCPVHGKQLGLLCFECRRAKCTDCITQCKSLGHAPPQLLKEPQGEKLLADAKENIERLQRLVLGKSKKAVQLKDLVRKVELARDIHLHEHKTKIKYAMDALSQSYEKTEDIGRILAEVLTSQAEAANSSSTAQTQHLHFGPPSSGFELPCICNDLSVTSEGHVLLAAEEQGLRECDLSGLELSSWRPPAWSEGKDDSVNTIAALEGERAVVGMCWSRLLVLLQRSPADRAAWLVERHVAELESPPRQLSVLGDVVAVALCRQDDQQLRSLRPSPQLQLVRLSSGQTLYSDSRDYNVHSVALIAAGVVTASDGPLVLGHLAGQNRHAFSREDIAAGIVDVVDCFSHRGERLWRHALSDEVWVAGVCAAPARQLLVCVYGRDDRGKDCVVAIDGEDGKKVKDVLVKSHHRVKLPMRLSLTGGRQQQEVLAVLCTCEAESGLWNKVIVHTAVSC